MLRRKIAGHVAASLVGIVVGTSGCSSGGEGSNDATTGTGGGAGSGGSTSAGPGTGGGGSGTGGGGSDTGGGGSDTGGGGSDTGGGSGTGGDADPCAGGTVGAASDSAASDTHVNGFGFVELDVSTQNQIIALETTLTVPPSPPASGTLFLWPGLQPSPGGHNYDVLDNGVLQPVLTWGPTCAPTSPVDPYASWWVSAQYVNTFIIPASPFYDTYSGCRGGQGMDVAVATQLKISMSLSGTTWNQIVTDAQTGASVSFSLDMLEQAQHRALFVIEDYARPPVSDVVFTSTILKFASPEADACQAQWRGESDYFAAPVASRDGLHCCISRIILRAEGVSPTSPNGP
ncbi:hypothetical protein [Sorangium sp. So ce1153]|uniref:hypothetical protein n=1 Tax=Sorangium sp. So ce1153 TaxID=3133333 RepID=UPI003F63874D